jgi:cell wall-associated NlpC family hydrolase
MARPRFSKLALLALAALVALTAVQAASASPVSEKKARLREVQAKLDKVGTQVEMAVEDYNQAVSRLDTVKAKITENQKLLKAAEENLEAANRQLAARAESIYKAPEAGFVDVVFSARSFEDLVAQMDLFTRLGNSDVDTVKSIEAYERDIKDRRVELKSDERTASELVDRRQEQKEEIQALNAKLENLTAGIKADIERLQAEQAAASRAAAQAAQQAAAGGGSTGGSAAPLDPGGPGRPAAVNIAQRYLGIPYVWGGASPSGGFDCSGLTLYVYAQLGVQLSHGATDQQRASTPVPLSALLPGDLVFFGNASYSHHVGIYAGGGQMIAAPRTGDVVRYSPISGAWIGGRF